MRRTVGYAEGTRFGAHNRRHPLDRASLITMGRLPGAKLMLKKYRITAPKLTAPAAGEANLVPPIGQLRAV
jgi:hypothetical protein